MEGKEKAMAKTAIYKGELIVHTKGKYPGVEDLWEATKDFELETNKSTINDLRAAGYIQRRRYLGLYEGAENSNHPNKLRLATPKDQLPLMIDRQVERKIAKLNANVARAEATLREAEANMANALDYLGRNGKELSLLNAEAARLMEQALPEEKRATVHRVEGRMGKVF
jgi:hypothetical protein